MRRTGQLVTAALLGLLGLERPASACGYWMLDDLELGVRIVFLIHAMDLQTEPGKRIEKKLHLAWKSKPRSAAGFRAVNYRLMETDSWEQIDGAPWMFGSRDGRKLITFVKDTVRLSGRQVGTLVEDRLTLGAVSYELALPSKPKRGLLGFELKVTRGATLIARGDAMAWCGSSSRGSSRKRADEQARREIRQRATLYLSWRQLLRPREIPAAVPAPASAPAP